jgi:hypothetical protein
MCDFSSLTKKMFESLADIEKGRFVYVIAIKATKGREVAIEDVICEEVSNPQWVLEHYCKSKGKAMDAYLCLPVILPPGLKAVDVRGFRPIRTKDAFWIEYTKEGPERPDATTQTSTGL